MPIHTSPAAVEELVTRDVAFLGLTETVGQFELRPMTVRDYLVLRIAASPLLLPDGAVVTPGQLLVFLWTVSSWNCPGVGPITRELRRLVFLRKHRPLFVSPPVPHFVTHRGLLKWQRRRADCLLRTAATATAARAYVKGTFADRPGSSAGKGTPSYFSDVCFWWGFLGRHGYRMTLPEVLNMPIKVLFQCVREIMAAGGQTLVNPSQARERDEMLKKLNGQPPENEHR